jgi:hypothetical protein
MLYSRPAPGWKRVDIEYFSLDRLEAYPTLRLLCKVDASTRKFGAFVPSATLAIMEAFGATVGFLMLLWILFCGVYAILIFFILFILYAIMKNTKRTADLLEQMESFQKPFSVRLLGDRGASSATSASFRLSGTPYLLIQTVLPLNLHEPASSGEMDPGGVDRRGTPGAAISR